jgi:hypothetical protein
LFFWFPFFGFVTIVPIFLAVLNCWDLRRRMNPKAGEQFR